MSPFAIVLAVSPDVITARSVTMTHITLTPTPVMDIPMAPFVLLAESTSVQISFGSNLLFLVNPMITTATLSSKSTSQDFSVCVRSMEDQSDA
jgi:hypothetical protein